eukprot:RCo037137
MGRRKFLTGREVERRGIIVRLPKRGLIRMPRLKKCPIITGMHQFKLPKCERRRLARQALRAKKAAEPKKPKVPKDPKKIAELFKARRQRSKAKKEAEPTRRVGIRSKPEKRGTHKLRELASKLRKQKAQKVPRQAPKVRPMPLDKFAATILQARKNKPAPKKGEKKAKEAEQKS